MPQKAKHWDSNRYTVYRNQFAKTKLCRYYAAGVCTKGADCSFAHGAVELNMTPDLKKTALCEDFEKGECPLPSNECSYAHGQDELRSSPAFRAIRKDVPPDQPSAAVKIQQDARERLVAAQAVPNVTATKRKLCSQSGSSNNRNLVQFLGCHAQVPALPAFANGVQELAPQYPQQHVEQANHAHDNMKSLLSQQQMLLQALGARDRPGFGLSGHQKVLLSSQRALNELMMKADLGLASHLAPPGLAMAGHCYTRPAVAAAAAAALAPVLAEDVIRLKPRIDRSPIFDDEPQKVPLPRFASFSDSCLEHVPRWSL